MMHVFSSTKNKLIHYSQSKKDSRFWSNISAPQNFWFWLNTRVYSRIQIDKIYRTRISVLFFGKFNKILPKIFQKWLVLTEKSHFRAIFKSKLGGSWINMFFFDFYDISIFDIFCLPTSTNRIGQVKAIKNGLKLVIYSIWANLYHKYHAVVTISCDLTAKIVYFGAKIANFDSKMANFVDDWGHFEQ